MGTPEGHKVGTSVSVCVGLTDGSLLLGVLEGIDVLGTSDGTSVGISVGIFVGNSDGSSEGITVGVYVGM